MTNSNNDFIQEYAVGDKNFKVDSLLLLSLLTLSGAIEDPTPAAMIDSMRKAIRPIEDAANLLDEEAYALSLRIMMNMRALGKIGAP
jgi:hypothetical protein